MLQETKNGNARTEATWIDSVEAMIRHRRGEPALARLALQSAAASRGQRFQARSDR